MNHSRKSNATFVQAQEQSIAAIALRPIRKGEEITVDYRNAMSVNGAGLVPLERVTQ
jgi:SET domain-containing protein